MRDAGFLDMYVVDSEELSKKTDKKDKKKLLCGGDHTGQGTDGFSAQVQDRKQLIDFARKWTDKGVEIYVISRPEAYGEYGHIPSRSR